MSNRIVIIGSGAAAASAVKTMRSIDSQSEILVFGEEKYYPYYRIKISKGILGELEEERLLIYKKEWYETNNVTLRLDTKVIGVLPEKKEITLQDGSSLSYSKLLLANGASNFIPPIKGINKPGVFSLRTLDGAQNIVEHLKNSETILLIGGGVQNLEMANILSKAGKRVIIAEFASRLMPRQLDIHASDILRESIEDSGAQIMLSTQVAEILGRGRVEGFITQSGSEHSCDMVIYSTGILPNIDIAKNTGIDINKGIWVNENMETSIADIYAAGDVAEFNGRVYGLWGSANQQGKIAGANICNQNMTFEPAPSLTTMDAFGLSFYSIGDIIEHEGIELLIEKYDENQKYTKLLVRDNIIVGAIVIGDSKRFMLLKSLIERKAKAQIKKSALPEVGEFILELQSSIKAV